MQTLSRAHVGVIVSLVLGILQAPLQAQQLSWVKRSYGNLTSQIVATNADGSAIVAGYFAGSVTFGAGEPNETTLIASTSATGAQRWTEIYLAKFSPDGSLLWVRAIRADESDPNFPPAQDLSYPGGVVLPRGGLEISAVKCAPDGSFAICGSLYPPTTFGEGEPNETTLLSGFYGYVPPGGVLGYPYFYIAKYDSDGHLLWAREDGSDGAQVAAFDVGPDGDVYVTGVGSDPTILGIGTPAEINLGAVGAFVARYGSDGILKWVRALPPYPGASFSRILVPSDGGFVVAGSFSTGGDLAPVILGAGEPNETALTTSFDAYPVFFVARFDGEGSLSWARQAVMGLDDFSSFTFSYPLDAGTAPDGSILASLEFGGRMTLGSGEIHETTLDVFAESPQRVLVRYEQDGELRWARALPTANGLSNFVVQPSGSFFALSASAASVGSPGSAGASLEKYLDDGTVFGTGLIKAQDTPTGEVFPLALTSVGGFDDGSFIATTPPRDMIVGVGEPNASSISDPDVPGRVILRFRGESTDLEASTDANGVNPVTVVPTNPAEAGDSDVQITFPEVTTSGTTTVVVTKGVPAQPLPANFQVGDPPQWYEISTTAGLPLEGDPPMLPPDKPIIVCIQYDENGISDELALRIMHFENGMWVPLELAPVEEGEQNPDTVANRICGLTYSLSPFVVGRFVGPVAVAGRDQSIHAGQTVHLDGSESFADNTASELLEYAWTIISAPVGSTASLTDGDTATPSFVADLPGTYQVSLVVTDLDQTTSTPDVVQISSLNTAPSADAGPLETSAIVGRIVQANGSASYDPDDDPLSFSWTIRSKPAGSTATLVDANTATPTFVPDLSGSYTIELIVHDGFAPSAPDTTIVSAITPEQYAEAVILDAMGFAAGLAPFAVTNAGNQQAFGNLLNQAVQALHSGKLSVARQKLEEAITRTDGWVLRGRADPNGPGRDWIIDSGASVALYAALTAALGTIP